MDLNIYYLAGMACGVIAVAVILWVLNSWAKKKNQGPMEFDEMQLIARQKAAMHGFCVLVVLSLLFGGLAPRTILDGYSAMFIAAFAGLGVFACECVMRHAYYKVGEQSRRWPVVLAVIAGINYLSAFQNSRSHGGLMDGTVLHLGAINLLCAIVMTVLLIALAIRWLMDRTEDRAA